ncbi:hypothetical protein [Tunturiibacter gelidiferens]|uniref:Acyltransferase 3 domain-containing protein n=1 Tax=Tunturiibacter gelidiferens TaxID=3069689 RepID=A0AAU7Z086_9BACT
MRSYFHPELDVLRFVAFLMVFLYHSADYTGIIAHAKPCASHKKKLAKRHTKTRPATDWLPSTLGVCV